MTGKTHVLGGLVVGIGDYLCVEAAGLTIEGVNPFIQLGVILPYAIWSSTLPDLDQDRSSKAMESPFNLVIQKFCDTGWDHLCCPL